MAKLPFILLIASFLSCFMIYYGAVNGPYIVDDYPHLVDNDHLIIAGANPELIKKAALSSTASSYYRPLSMLTFAANYSLSGNKSAYSIKLTNIIFHLLIGLGIFLLSRQLLAGVFTEDIFINFSSASTTAMWLAHPLFVSTVLYSIQRMAMLSTFFVIYGCVGYFYFREKTINEGKRFFPIIIFIPLMTLLGFLSKENGALLPGFLLLIEIYWFKFAFNRDVAGYKKLILMGLLVLPTLFIVAFLVQTYAGNADSKTPMYPFTYKERLLTQFRVMWHYLGWLWFMNPEPLGIYHDNIEISKSIMSPSSTLWAILGWLLLLCSSLLLNKYTRIFSFCLLWFLWGHCLESSVIPLSPMFEHRNYLPGFGAILALSALLTFFIKTGGSGLSIKTVIAGLIIFILPNALLYERVQCWKDEKTLTLSLLESHPDSTGVLVMATDYLNRSGDIKHALEAVQAAQRLSPEQTSLLFAELVVRCENIPDEPFDDALKHRMRSIKLYDISTSSLVFYKRVTDSCFQSTINHQELIYFYKIFSGSSNNLIVSLSYYGLGNIYIHRKDYANAVVFWEKAVETSHNARPLIPKIKQLKALSSGRSKKDHVVP